jgi:hypothetical protein
MKLHPVFLFFPLLLACKQTPADRPAAAASVEKFALPEVVRDNNYWYQGKAEINSYAVVQERYGEEREAAQVMVFVTEDFSAAKQVKLDAAPGPGDTRVPVLKLNTIRRFKTGIYDYALMQSVFTPTAPDAVRSLKTTTSIQDWCGQVFVQCNASGEAYKIRSFSYFESESDAETAQSPGLLEDEIWTRIRLKPESLNGLKTTVLPAVFYSRFRHETLRAEPAEINVEKNGKESTLTLSYTNIPRRLSIRFESEFPHRILGWEERDKGQLLSKGSLKQTMLDAYWQHHDLASAPLRARLDPGF